MMKHHVKNFRPQYLVMGAAPLQRKGITNLAQMLYHGNGLVLMARVVLPDDNDVDHSQDSISIADNARENLIKYFYNSYNVKLKKFGVFCEAVRCPQIFQLLFLSKVYLYIYI